MGNDPKDTKVDLSKLLTNLESPGVTPKTMITKCNESADLIGVETSTVQKSLIGRENFSKGEKADDNT